MDDARPVRKPIVVGPGEGRSYPMGRMRSVFIADCDETAGRYSVSEWWLEPRTRGPHVHQHHDDHVFYVLEGTVSLEVSGEWSHVTTGTYVVIPGGTPHTFENQSSETAGFISFTEPGGFEERMPDIAADMAAKDLRL